AGAGARALLPAPASVQAVATLYSSRQSSTLAVLSMLPNPPGMPAGTPPMTIYLAIATGGPISWRLPLAVTKGFAQEPKLSTAKVAGVEAAGVTYGIGANSKGLLVLRDAAVVYDGVADGVVLKDLNGDGSAEVLRSWSPFCQSHVASPRLSTVYQWQQGTFAVATGSFPAVLAQDQANFKAAVARANLPATRPVWTGGQKACLHDALGYIAQEGGQQAEAQAQFAQVKQLDPTYDVSAIQKAASGLPARTSP
ncbi:MAG: hypothetical protein ACRDGF_04585, partial [Chloroflexota bacterium]